MSIGVARLDPRGSTSDPGLSLLATETAGAGSGMQFGGYVGARRHGRDAWLLDVSFISRDMPAPADGELQLANQRIRFSGHDSQTVVVAAGVMQRWLTSRVWIRGGAGTGSLGRDVDVPESGLTVTVERDVGFALVAGFGLDLPGLWRHPAEVTSVEVRYVTFAIKGLRVHAPAVQIGFTWR